mmetsp:Transcript_33334/g.55932  ORF Transcript_33334/g.55932 Transcript_33334/m.55932 type:complete len:340 (+) Transcript_33334:164-1183(+)
MKPIHEVSNALSKASKFGASRHASAKLREVGLSRRLVRNLSLPSPSCSLSFLPVSGDLSLGWIRSRGLKKNNFACKGYLTTKGIWVDDEEEEGESKGMIEDPDKWWQKQWFAAKNLAAIEVLANMKDVPGVDVNARTPKPRWRPEGKPEVHGRTVLSLAAESGDSDAIRFFVSLGCDRELADAEGYTPAHYAAEEGHAECLRALIQGGVEASGLDARDPTLGHSPLILACAGGHTEAVEVLLEAGADVHIVCKTNATGAGWCYQRRNAALLAVILAAAGPSGCRRCVRGDQRYRTKQKELRSQLGLLNPTQLAHLARAWRGCSLDCPTVEDLMKVSNKQ